MKRCTRCGTMMPDGQAYCTNCGAPLAAAAGAGMTTNAQEQAQGHGRPAPTVPPVPMPVPQPAAAVPSPPSAVPQPAPPVPMPTGMPGAPDASAAGGDASRTGGRKKHGKAVPIIAAIVAVLLVVASVTGFLVWRHMHATDAADTTQSAASAKPKKKTAEPKTTPKKTTKPKVSEVAMTDFVCDGHITSDWQWTGSALVSVPIPCRSGDSTTDTSDSSTYSSASDPEDGEYSVGVWTPAMDQSKEIHISMLESGEKEYSEPKIAATYGDNPAVFVMYAVKTKAVGTTPESVHLYAHQVDLDAGTLGKRIDLRTEEDNHLDKQEDYNYGILGSSNTTVAIAKTWVTDEPYPGDGDHDDLHVGHTQVMGLTRDKTEAATLQNLKDSIEDQGYGYKSVVKTTASNVTMQDVYMVTDSSGYHLYSIDGNKQTASFGEDYCPGNSDVSGCSVETIRYIGGDHYAISSISGDIILDTSTGKGEYMTTVLGIDDAKPYTEVDAWDQFSDGTLYILYKGYDGEKRVFLLDKDLKKTEVLDSDQWNRLLLDSGEFHGINYLTKRIYVKTTDQQITVDEHGESTGEYTELPEESVFTACDHTAMKWMKWSVAAHTGDGSDTRGDTVTVTRGQEPGQPAPSTGTDDSGTGSGADTDSDSDTD
ncbi:zinc ribbon domain-containing protein [Bifidobacterium saguinibicoloris]|uniref:zinc ribbon domain-containing protein n=1 Tax=Bifidobacterium saguinibicoloris TaxID=2834433 RepID=UPI00237C15D6|nr:zinc ribbon domain-containing protein [Bifidobacterium saguinibicoloris]